MQNRCYEGNLGTGKTLNMVYDIMQLMRWRIRVISNTPIFWCSTGRKLHQQRHNYYRQCRYYGEHYGAEYYADADEFYHAILSMDHGLVAVDEAGILFNKKFAKLPVETLIKLVQSRKQRLNLWYTAQSFMMLDPIFRLITTEVYQCWRSTYVPMMWQLPRYQWHKKRWDWVDGRVFSIRCVDPILCIKRLSTGQRGTGSMYVRYYRTLYPRQYIPAMRAYDTYRIVDSMPVGYRSRGETRVESTTFFAPPKNTEGHVVPVEATEPTKVDTPTSSPRPQIVQPRFFLRLKKTKKMTQQTESGIDPSLGQKS